MTLHGNIQGVPKDLPEVDTFEGNRSVAVSVLSLKDDSSIDFSGTPFGLFHVELCEFVFFFFFNKVTTLFGIDCDSL